MKIVFILSLLVGVNLRPYNGSDNIEHEFVCVKGTERNSTGITYDEKGRYYDIAHHGACPRPGMKDYHCNVEYKGCTNGRKYHCAKDSITGNYSDACALPVLCKRGKEPIIQYPEGIAKIVCQQCVKGRFNNMKRTSNTYSECKLKQRCVQYEEIECIVEGDARFWTERKCRCNWKSDYIPTNLETLKKKLDTKERFCQEYNRCYRSKCKISQGKRQERLSDYSCAYVCDPDYQRINESGECVFTESNSTTANTSSGIESSTTSTTKEILSLSSSTFTTSVNYYENTTLDKAREKDVKSDTVVIVCISVVVVIIFIVAVVVASVKVCRYRKTTEALRNTKHPGTPRCTEYTRDSIKVEWDQQADDKEHNPFLGFYIIEKKKVGDHQKWQRTKKFEGNSYKFTELEENTEYVFRVATFHKKKVGNFSQSSRPIKLQSKPTVTADIKGIVEVNGNPFSIVVPFTGTPEPTAKWTKDDTAVDEEEDRVTLEIDRSNATLANTRSRRKDSGTYKLKLSNRDGDCEITVKVNIKDVPGKPTGPLEVWSKSDNKCLLKWNPPEDNGGSDLTYIVEIEDINKEWRTLSNYAETNEYKFQNKDNRMCNFRVIARNELGPGEPLETEDPYVPALPRVTGDIRDIVQVSGSPFSIVVPFTGAPIPNAEWTKDSTPVDEEEDRVTLINDSSNAILTNICSRRKDSGNYKLKLSNQNGKCKTSVKVNIKDVPGRPTGPLKVWSGSDNDRLLKWNSPKDDGGSAITYIVERKCANGPWCVLSSSVKKNEYEVTVDDQQEYSFMVTAKNEQGTGKPLETEKPYVLGLVPHKFKEDRGAQCAVNAFARDKTISELEDLRLPAPEISVRLSRNVTVDTSTDPTALPGQGQYS